jgi:hypothetical protein
MLGRQGENPGLVWIAEECRSNNVKLERLVRAAERAHDREVAAFFRRALAVSQRLAAV